MFSVEAAPAASATFRLCTFLGETAGGESQGQKIKRGKEIKAGDERKRRRLETERRVLLQPGLLNQRPGTRTVQHNLLFWTEV